MVPMPPVPSPREASQSQFLPENTTPVPPADQPTATRAELSPVPNPPTVASNGVEYFPVASWNVIPWLWHGFASRRGGVTRAYTAPGAPGELNLGFTPEDDRAHVLQNRVLLAEAVTSSPATPLVTLRQVHSNVVVLSQTLAEPAADTPCEGDGLITAQPGVLLAIQTADCIPVLVADRRQRVVAAFHAGWRGTVQRIAESGIGRLRMEFGSRPEDLVAAIGPGVGVCCYAVGDEVIARVRSQFAYADSLFRAVIEAVPLSDPAHFTPQTRPHLDLIEANRRQLQDAGVPASSIEVIPGCTHCRPDLFFSYRQSKGRCGRMMSVIGVRPE